MSNRAKTLNYLPKYLFCLTLKYGFSTTAFVLWPTTFLLKNEMTFYWSFWPILNVTLLQCIDVVNLTNYLYDYVKNLRRKKRQPNQLKYTTLLSDNRDSEQYWVYNIAKAKNITRPLLAIRGWKNELVICTKADEDAMNVTIVDGSK